MLRKVISDHGVSCCFVCLFSGGGFVDREYTLQCSGMTICGAVDGKRLVACKAKVFLPGLPLWLLTLKKFLKYLECGLSRTGECFPLRNAT